MSSGARVVTHFIKELTPGVTPETPEEGDWKTARLTGNTLTPTPNVQASDEVTEKRLSQGSSLVGLKIGGQLNAELSYGTFDDWLAALFYGNWENNVLSIGTERHTFSVQKAYTDVGTYHLFKGVHVENGSIEIPEEGKITLTFGCQALDYEDGDASFVTDPQEPTTTPFTSSLSVGSILVNGTNLAGSACVSAMTVSINNSVQLQRCLGSGKKGPGAIIETEADITGDVTVAWSARAWQIWKTQFLRTPHSLIFPITDSLGNKYSFNFPSVEFDGELPSGGKRDLIKAQLKWTVAKASPTITREAA